MSLPNVAIGMPVGSQSIPWPTAVSLISTIRVLDKEGIKFKLESLVGSSIVQWARSVIVGKFLKTGCTHLFWVDSDLMWTPNDFIRILGWGAHHDVVGATYPFKADKINFLVNRLNPNQWEVNGHGLLRVRSMAMGFTLCKRAVIEKLVENAPIVHDDHNGVSYPDLFRVDRTVDEGGRLKARGEDVAFFDDVRAAGFDVWLDPSINLGHIGVKRYSGDVIDSLGLQEFAKEQR